MKKIIVLLLTIGILFSFVGCAKEDEKVESPDDLPIVSENGEQNSENPKEEGDLNEGKTEKPENKPEDETNEDIKSEVSIQNIVDTMRNTYGENYLPNMELDQETFNALLGIDGATASEYYSEFYAGMPMMSTQVDKLFIVKTSDATKMSEVFTNYMTIQVEDAMQYPMNLSKLENYTLSVYEDYVILFILGGYSNNFVEDDDSKTPEEMEAAQAAIDIAYYKEQHQLGEEALKNLFTNGYVAVEDNSEETEEVLEVENTTEPEVENTTEVAENA